MKHRHLHDVPHPPAPSARPPPRPRPITHAPGGRGLVQVFSGLGLSSGAADTKAVALGISMALNCTIFGLSIAVPSLIAFSYFSKKVEILSVQMESIVSDLIAKCYYGRTGREEGRPLRSTVPASAPLV